MKYVVVDLMKYVHHIAFQRFTFEHSASGKFHMFCDLANNFFFFSCGSRIFAPITLDDENHWGARGRLVTKNPGGDWLPRISCATGAFSITGVFSAELPRHKIHDSS